MSTTLAWKDYYDISNSLYNYICTSYEWFDRKITKEEYLRRLEKWFDKSMIYERYMIDVEDKKKSRLVLKCNGFEEMMNKLWQLEDLAKIGLKLQSVHTPCIVQNYDPVNETVSVQLRLLLVLHLKNRKKRIQYVYEDTNTNFKRFGDKWKMIHMVNKVTVLPHPPSKL